MPRAINPAQWELVNDDDDGAKDSSPLVQFRNPDGHVFSIHPITDTLVRVVHQLPGRPNGVALRDNHHGKIHWEQRGSRTWSITRHDNVNHTLTLATRTLRIQVDYSQYMTLTWYWSDSDKPFLRDFKKGYTYDAVSGRVWHYTCRGDSYMPRSEHQARVDDEEAVSPRDGRTSYIYGLGETKGRLDKTGHRYTIDGRDSLAADPTSTDPLYKLTPFYMRYDSQARLAYGMYYNSLNPSVFDFGAEHDFSTGDFDSFSCEHGPLDYYVLLGHTSADSSLPPPSRRPTIPSILTQFARLVTPPCHSPAGHHTDQWQVSPTLPRLSQFGYLASSLTLSERNDAQQAVMEYVDETRAHGFAIDSMHLSSGYCQDESTQERQFFHWNKKRYPDPAAMGKQLEQDRDCQVIINVKPWLLESHPWYQQTAEKRAFVQGAKDGTEDTLGTHGQSRTLHWSSSMGQTAKGSYFDFSSANGCEAWSDLIGRGVLDMGITGMWIDNNEYSTLIDDADVFAGEVSPWTLPSNALRESTTAPSSSSSCSSTAVSRRMAGWSGSCHAGTWGRATQTMGMARCTYSTLLSSSPNLRPTIITRSAVPGMQAFTQATWSGDNSTTWLSFKWGVKLSLSYGLSFGIGLYGQDIGGFAGKHSPSPELLVRWCQQSMWTTRFTVHSWKEISTTLWMYDEHEAVNNDDLDGKTVKKALHDALDWRYQLIPMLYSLYVMDYFRRGWPVVRPLLWYHSRDEETLTQDEQFLVGSHILVAPVLDFGQRHVQFRLPSSVCPCPEDEPDNWEEAWWYEPSQQRWYGPESTSDPITLAAPITTCPYLVRAGGIVVTSPRSEKTKATTVFRPSELRTTRIVTLYPGPFSSLSQRSARMGHFTLVEDDGVSNDATSQDGAGMTEIDIRFAVCDTDLGCVDVDVSVGALKGYAGEWKLMISLADGDTRRLRATSSVREGRKGVSVTEDVASTDVQLVLRVRVDSVE